MEAGHPFLRALELVGNAAMAGALRVTPQMVSKMAKAARADPRYQVPAKHLLAIERITEEKITLAELLFERQAEPAEGQPARAA